MAPAKRLKIDDGESVHGASVKGAVRQAERIKREKAAVEQAAQRTDALADAAAAVEARKQARQAEQRPAMRESARSGVVAMSREGHPLTRTRTGAGDPYAIPPEIIPPGWDYQWNAITVVGNKEILMDQNLQMEANGWRPVPASRHDGRFMPVGHSGSIIRGGLRLDERPMVLSEEARAEDLRNAKRLISDRNESLKLTGIKRQLGEGIEMNQRYRGTGGDIRMSIDSALDIPKPQHQIAGPDE